MSEVQSRPAAPRGRGGSARGRGGFSGRGRTRGGHATNGDKFDVTTATSIEDDGEVGQLKKQYGDKVTTIKEMFPDWTDEDIVFALQETDGDLMTTVERITDGKTSKQYSSYQAPVVLLIFCGSHSDLVVQVQFRNGEKFRTQRKTDPDLRLRTLPSPTLRTNPHECPAVVELALTVAEEAVAVVLIEAEVAGPVEHQLRTQTAHARRTSNHLFLPLNRMHGVQLLRQMRHLGTLLPSLLKRTLVGVRPPPRLLLRLLRWLRMSHQASFQTVLRRAGQACLQSRLLLQRQRRLSRLRSMLSPTV